MKIQHWMWGGENMKIDIKYYSTTRKLAIELSIISLNYSVRTQKTDLSVFWFIVQRERANELQMVSFCRKLTLF